MKPRSHHPNRGLSSLCCHLEWNKLNLIKPYNNLRKQWGQNKFLLKRLWPITSIPTRFVRMMHRRERCQVLLGGKLKTLVKCASWRSRDSSLTSTSFSPGSVDELRKILRVANEFGIPFWTFSRGKNLGWVALSHECQLFAVALTRGLVVMVDQRPD